MKRAVAYCRVSTDRQAGEDKFGIEAQKQSIEEYCAKNDIEVVDWYIDEGVSGAEKRRPAFDRILGGEITNPPIQYVIVAKTDRISRDINLYYCFKNLLLEANIEILSVAEDWSAQDRLTALILENFLAMAATLERENIRIRTSGGRRLKAKQGGYAGGKAPTGYYVENGRLFINEEEAEIVRFIFDRKRKGCTMLSTVSALNEAGYKTRNGKDFVISTVQSIWNNEKTYLGWYKYGKDGEWVKGVHEPILDPEKS